MDRRTWREEVAEVVAATGVVDCHHHTQGASQRKANPPGLFSFIDASYWHMDLVAAGMPLDGYAADGATDERKWAIIRKYLPKARNTTYYRAVNRGFQDLFGTKGDLSDDNWREIDERLRAASGDDDWFEEVLGRRMKLKHGVLDWHVGGTTVHSLAGGLSTNWYHYILEVRPGVSNEVVNGYINQRLADTRFFHPSIKLDALFHAYLPQCRAEIERLYKVEMAPLGDLTDLLAYVDLAFEQMERDGAVAVKSALAGQRSLAYRPTPRQKAEVVFARPIDQLTRQNVVDFENFLMYHVVGKAAQHGWPIQFHTGTPFSGFVPDEDTRPDLLLELILANPETRFDLMHCSYPFTGRLGNLAKRFPNVFINLAWTCLISSEQLRRIVAGWLDMVPANKIFWGGDAVYVEETYGAFVVARDAVSEALADLIEQDLLNKSAAAHLAQRIFHHNAMEFFPIAKRLSS